MNLKQELTYAIELARGAGKIVLDHYGKVQRLTKRHAEAVTPADRASQRFIVEGLRKRFPADGIIGEENDTGDAITFDCPDPKGRVWVIDPIDGTNNFVAGFHQFAVCIGLLHEGWPVLGVVYEVCRDVVYSAAVGEGAWVNHRQVEALSNPLNESSLLMMTSNVLDPTGRLPQWAARWIGQTHWKVRNLGSAALEAVQVAAGVAHGAVTINGKLWDCVAPAAIVLEAGGLITDLQGNSIFPFDLAHYDGAKVPFLAGGKAAHETLLREIENYP